MRINYVVNLEKAKATDAVNKLKGKSVVNNSQRLYFKYFKIVRYLVERGSEDWDQFFS